MTTCQTAGNEFLRQFWTAVYPPASDLQTLATASPMHKAAKADRMADYLSRTPAKIDALVQAGREEGVDPTRVQLVRKESLASHTFQVDSYWQALQPLLDAVERALHFYRTRKPPR
jgi:transcription initiation factor TFIIH subunit 1